MTSPVDLEGLATRVEALQGPDREVDAEISAALRLDAVPAWAKTWAAPWRANPDGRVTLMHLDGSEGPHFTAREWTASLDAAMTLVPEGVEGLRLSFKVEHFYLGNGIWHARASVWDGLGCVSSLDTASVSATPALALTAAALRARAALEASNG